MSNVNTILTYSLTQDKLMGADDEVLLQRAPTPPKPKVFLPPIDAAPFVRTRQGEADFVAAAVKDEAFVREQEERRKGEVGEFVRLREQMARFREDERKYRLYQKLKQIEECEILQVGGPNVLEKKKRRRRNLSIK